MSSKLSRRNQIRFGAVKFKSKRLHNEYFAKSLAGVIKEELLVFKNFEILVEPYIKEKKPEKQLVF